MRQIVLILRYDGAAYHGWQVQQNAKTVQGTIENAISKITQQDTRVTGCGRTDTGVHAHIYVASFLTDSKITCERLPLALNSMLPYDISVLRALEVDDDFHPIRSCEKKEYTYTVYTSPVRDPFLNTRALHLPHEFDLELVKKASAHFVGEHDFASMRSLGTDVFSTVRTVYYCDVERENQFLRFRICANGFLYNMARTITGTLLKVASGNIQADSIPQILLSGDRSMAGPTAPACGLALTGLWYTNPDELKEVRYV